MLAISFNKRGARAPQYLPYLHMAYYHVKLHLFALLSLWSPDDTNASQEDFHVYTKVTALNLFMAWLRKRDSLSKIPIVKWTR